MTHMSVGKQRRRRRKGRRRRTNSYPSFTFNIFKEFGAHFQVIPYDLG